MTDLVRNSESRFSGVAALVLYMNFHASLLCEKGNTNWESSQKNYAFSLKNHVQMKILIINIIINQWLEL